MKLLEKMVGRKLEEENCILQNELDRLIIAYAKLEFKYKNVKAELMYYKKGDEAD